MTSILRVRIRTKPLPVALNVDSLLIPAGREGLIFVAGKGVFGPVNHIVDYYCPMSSFRFHSPLNLLEGEKMEGNKEIKTSKTKEKSHE